MKIKTSTKAEPLSGIEPAVAEVLERLQKKPAQWVEQLRAEPGAFVDVEKSVHATFRQMADHVVAGVLAEVTKPAEFGQTAKKKIAESKDAEGKATHRSGEARPLRVRLLGGLVLHVMTLYCAPMIRTGKKRGPEGGGLYPELGVLGISEGKSPALLRRIGRLSALLPSYAAVREELLEDGIKLTQKEVHGIGVHACEVALTYRKREMEQYRAGQLPAGDGKGKRFAAQIDGGRCKIRKATRKQKGLGKSKKQKRRFKSAWREPKLLVIYELDQDGTMKKGTEPIIDGTFESPNEIMEILAMRLHQVGASEADMVVFRSDGAPWIWERLDWVIKRLGLSDKQVSKGLDWAHAVHHVSLALEAVLDGAERKRVFKKMRKWLKAGRWEKMVHELIALGSDADLPSKSPLWNAADFLDRHGSKGHLDYAAFSRGGLPLGSGAIESTIRRVVNLRMKGNSIHWLKENAEGMLLLRGLVLSGRWNQSLTKSLVSLASDRRLHWDIQSPDMPLQLLKTPATIKPPKAQLQAEHEGYGAAA